MKHKVFTVYDAASEAYLQPFFLQTRGQAIRSFSDAVNNPEHQFFKHKKDYTLFELGEYEDGSAQFDMLKSPIALGNALEFVNKDG